ncbi:MAG: S-ribosylhomocysteine lyase, partial [Actinomycetes bacterium]|nr:S-ribosylhomocysteine lyase [Actinomycetes bacterium]
IVDFSPMGCQTGFYLIVVGDHPDEEIRGIVAAALQDVLAATEVPAANEVQCGWGANHDLVGAQEAARAILAKRDEWAEVMA